jgi:hypothetical protein
VAAVRHTTVQVTKLPSYHVKHSQSSSYFTTGGLGVEPLSELTTIFYSCVRPLRFYFSWGVYSNEKTGVSVTGRLLFLSASRLKMFYNIYES